MCPEEYYRTVIIGKEDLDELTGWNWITILLWIASSQLTLALHNSCGLLFVVCCEFSARGIELVFSTPHIVWVCICGNWKICKIVSTKMFPERKLRPTKFECYMVQETQPKMRGGYSFVGRCSFMRLWQSSLKNNQTVVTKQLMALQSNTQNIL